MDFSGIPREVSDDGAVRIIWVSLNALILGLVAIAGAASSNGQTTEDGISKRVIGKPLYLKGCWRADKRISMRRANQ